MAKDNIYDQIITELIFRAEQNSSAFGPQIIISSNLDNNNIVPYSTSLAFEITSEIINIPIGYTVKANTHTISYPLMATDTSSSSVFTGSTNNTISGTAGWTYVVTVNVTLEKTASPDIVLSDTFTITAVSSAYFKANAVNNDFNLVGAVSTILDTSVNGTEIAWNIAATNFYLYFIVPTGVVIDHVLDHNQNVIAVSNFDVTTNGGYDYYVLSWFTQLSPAGIYNWKIIF